jgi:tryptophan 2,3-dioxygenase
MAERRDAGLTAVRLLAAIDQEFPRICGPRSVWTAGKIAVSPGAPSIIPGEAEIMFQFRDLEMATLQRMEATLEAPSLYDECLQLLSRRGFGIPEEVLVRDFSEPYRPHKAVVAAWLAVYHSTKTHWDLYELAERLMTLDHRFQDWRFSHMKTVERIIGHKPGTGGTSGVQYLNKALELRLFPELWQVRTSL